jgi:EAL domain-containing protein (putative c-di-GMP-specific phosphodiesterase class I)
VTGARLGTGSAFLQALARRMHTRLVVHVPDCGDARPLWRADADVSDAEIARLAGLGREWLARGAQTTDLDADGGFAVAAVRSGDGIAVGAIVATKQRGVEWSGTEQALLSFAAEFYGPLLDSRAADLAAPSTLSLDQPWVAGSDLEAGMRNAVGNGELSLVYQPEVDLVTREVTAVEALLRWQHPTRGELGPDSFIRFAERSDLIRLVGAWVIDESLRALGQWLSALPDLDIRLRVNVSPAQLAGDELVLLFGSALDAHGVPGDRVCVEITENVPVTDTGEVARTLHQLRRLGITSALDDLASGYSTLSHLRELPVDLVKIDRSLVSGLHQDRRAQAIVTAVVGLGLVLGLDVVAEGVENEEEAQALLQLGCTRAQGHHLGKPTVAAGVLDVLSAGARRVRVSR